MEELMLWLADKKRLLKRMFRNLKLMLLEYEDTILNIRANQSSWQNLIRKRTDIHVDVHAMKFPTSVIVIGQYKNRDYVRVFNLQHRDIKELVDQLQYMEEMDFGKLRRVDAAPDVSAAIHAERKMRW